MPDFFSGKKVFITGHTGFKGAWLSRILTMYGSKVKGYALEPPDGPSLFNILGLEKDMESVIADVRDRERLIEEVREFAPEIVIHLAAQPLVRTSYEEPVLTYETNVMGTVNILEAVRACGSVKSFLNVTTDKVYMNREDMKGYVETDILDGYDPYSNSKSCSDLITHSYRSSFFKDGPAVSAARAGNVLGGGDFAKDRIIPDCVRAAIAGEDIILRNPGSVRPFQHVLEPLWAYLLILKMQYDDRSLQGEYNVGPDREDMITVRELAEDFCREWGNGLSVKVQPDGGPHEAGLLTLDCSKIKSILGWKSRMNIHECVRYTAQWYKAWADGEDMDAVTRGQIRRYAAL